MGHQRHRRGQPRLQLRDATLQYRATRTRWTCFRRLRPRRSAPAPRPTDPPAPRRDVPIPRNADTMDLFPTAPPSSTFIGNRMLRKSQGAAVNSYLLTNAVFSANSAADKGGAVFLNQYVSWEIQDCTFATN